MLILAAIVFALIGLALGGGGAKLLMLGGSPYYLIAGIGFLLTAILLFMRKAAAIWLYTLVILGSLTWAVWEVGFDWWQLGPAWRHHRAARPVADATGGPASARI